MFLHLLASQCCGGSKLGSDLYIVAVLPLVCAVYLGSTFPLPQPSTQYRVQASIFHLQSCKQAHVHCSSIIVTLY